MAGVGSWPVAVVPVGPVSGASVLWRTRGRLHVTVVVKARFQMVQNGVMTALPPEDVRAPDETAPYLGQADVVVAPAHAHAVPPRDASALAVRVSLYRGWPMLDKSLLVYPTDAGGRRLERAYVDRLPLDLRGGGVRGLLVNPADPHRAARLGAIPVEAEERRSLVEGGAPPVRGQVVELPDVFPWRYYQVAPPDQRTGYLVGDEWLILDGMHPTQPRFQSRLPGAMAQVRVYPPGLAQGACYPVEMQADQLWIDGERFGCSLLWRGSFPVADEASARVLTLVAGVAVAGQPPAWPALPELLRSPILRAYGLTLASGSLDGIETVDAELEEELEPRSVRAPVAALAIGSDGVLAVHDSGEYLDLAPDPEDEEDDVATRQLTSGQSAAMRAALGLAAVDESRMLRPMALPGVPWAARRQEEAAAMSDPMRPPQLSQHDVDELELTLSEALEADGSNLAEIVARGQKKPGE
jgi:hypothetical protein